jgi:hypothetical protein
MLVQHTIKATKLLMSKNKITGKPTATQLLF